MKRMISGMLCVLLLVFMTACGKTQAVPNGDHGQPEVLSIQSTESGASDSVVPATGEYAGFTDVPSDAAYAEAVLYCQAHGLMSGTTSTTFEPESDLTRAMLVTVLYRSADSPVVTGVDNFSDTDPNAYYADAVLWASQEGLVSGYGNGLFGTNDPVSREQMTTILWRYAGSPSIAGTSSFRDAASVADYASAAVAWADANQIVVPVTSETFAPKNNATRAQVAMALMSFTQSILPETDPAPVTKQIQVTSESGHEIIFELNDSPAAQSLYDQLPLSIDVQDYGSNEKIFYPPEKLDTSNAILAEGPSGGLAYFSPWGNVVMYYSSYGPYNGLYQLGHAVSGAEWIETLSGTLQITQVLE